MLYRFFFEMSFLIAEDTVGLRYEKFYCVGVSTVTLGCYTLAEAGEDDIPRF